eukprot:3876562-Prorocentrum_lima.AAC.1
MQPGAVIMAAPAGRGQVPDLDSPMGQATIQPVETPLSTNWGFSEYPAANTTPHVFTPNPQATAAATWP